MLEFSEERSEHYSIKEHLPEIGTLINLSPSTFLDKIEAFIFT